MENISGTDQKPQNCYRGYRHTILNNLPYPSHHFSSILRSVVLSNRASVIPVRAVCGRACVLICIRVYIDDIYVQHTNNGIKKNLTNAGSTS